MDSFHSGRKGNRTNNSKRYVNNKQFCQETSDSSIYVDRTSKLKDLLEECNRLIKDDESEITIHCVGSAVQLGILLALQVCENNLGFQSSVQTFTVDSEDDVVPVTDQVDYNILKRNNSALRIRIFRLLPKTEVSEIVRWLGLTVFEIWINLIALLLFTILLALKMDPTSTVHSFTWWTIFFPLFASDALNAYFCIIVFIRMQLDSSLKSAFLRLIWSATFLFMVFLFKFLLCKRFMGYENYGYSEIFAPLYILLQLIAVRACQQT